MHLLKVNALSYIYTYVHPFIFDTQRFLRRTKIILNQFEGPIYIPYTYTLSAKNIKFK